MGLQKPKTVFLANLKHPKRSTTITRLEPYMIDPDISPETLGEATFADLKPGQLRNQPPEIHRRIVRDASWYNRAGRRVGWGDLTTDDFRRIQQDLRNPRWAIDDDELFVVLGDLESDWHYMRAHHSNPDRLGDQTVLEPGQDYVAHHGTFMISREGFYILGHLLVPGDFIPYPGLSLEVVDRGQFVRMISAAKAVA